jgi:hypothetical protein
MKRHRLLVALTLANLCLLAVLLTRVRADNPATFPVLRASAIELIDEHGKIRAELRIFPPNPNHKLPNGEPYPETVLFRLIDPNGRPSVKLATDVRGGGLYLGGAADPTYARIGASGEEPELFLQNKDGKQRKIQP